MVWRSMHQARARAEGRHCSPQILEAWIHHSIWHNGDWCWGCIPARDGIIEDSVLTPAGKKMRYFTHCIWQRKHFIPFVFSVDGLWGKDYKAASKQVASCLATKWQRLYSEVCDFIQSSLSITLFRNSSWCLRWDCNPSCRKLSISWTMAEESHS